jgi:hypothetical protein
MRLTMPGGICNRKTPGVIVLMTMEPLGGRKG